MKKTIKKTIKKICFNDAKFAAGASFLRSSFKWKSANLAWQWDDRSQPLKRVKLRHGVEMALDRHQWQDRMMYYGAYEQELLGLLRRTVSLGDHVTDVGANIGFISLYAEKIVGPGGGVDAFEPHPETYARLQKHVEWNQSSVKTHATALGAEAGELTLVQYANTSGLTSRFRRDSDLGLGVTENIQCQQVRLDSIESLRNTNFIKLDCEGSEGAVIAGAEGIISRNAPPIIYFEYCQEWRQYGAESLTEICNKIKRFQNAYQFHDLDRNLAKLDDAALLQMNDQQVANICCLPKS